MSEVTVTVGVERGPTIRVCSWADGQQRTAVEIDPDAFDFGMQVASAVVHCMAAAVEWESPKVAHGVRDVIGALLAHGLPTLSVECTPSSARITYDAQHDFAASYADMQTYNAYVVRMLSAREMVMRMSAPRTCATRYFARLRSDWGQGFVTVSVMDEETARRIGRASSGRR